MAHFGHILSLAGALGGPAELPFPPVGVSDTVAQVLQISLPRNEVSSKKIVRIPFVLSIGLIDAIKLQIQERGIEGVNISFGSDDNSLRCHIFARGKDFPGEFVVKIDIVGSGRIEMVLEHSGSERLLFGQLNTVIYALTTISKGGKEKIDPQRFFGFLREMFKISVKKVGVD